MRSGRLYVGVAAIVIAALVRRPPARVSAQHQAHTASASVSDSAGGEANGPRRVW